MIFSKSILMTEVEFAEEIIIWFLVHLYQVILETNK